MTATVTIRCWGCNKSETHPMVHGAELQKLQDDLSCRGWMRRAFYPSKWDKGPWFCSSQCAYESYNAKQAEKYRQEELDKEFKKYCEEVQPSWFTYLIGFSAIALLTYMVVRLLQ